MFLPLLAIAAPAAAFVGANVSMCSTTPSFTEWADMYGKTYQPTEMDYRMTVYTANVAKIDAHNAANYSWTMAVNKFADLTEDEFAARYIGGLKTRRGTSLRGGRSSTPFVWNATANPASVDWTTKGAVTPVKNQEQCGSCWAFSTTGSVEGAWFLANGTLPSLSEQQLVDCSTAEGNQGCNGGLMDYAFQYIITNKGITTEGAYPYTATGPNTCEAAGKPVAATLSSFTDVPANSETALETAIVKQPVSVAVEADQSVFQFYSGGVMDSACGTALDHGVLAVGYGTDAGKDYYKVKNSWGADWGMKGYILLGRGAKFNPSGQCGIQMDPSYPVV
jgi:C1A family cysteine protease